MDTGDGISEQPPRCVVKVADDMEGLSTMKKSRKYLGMVAAALLAAAPIAASAVSAVEAPVYAAEQTPTAADVQAIRDALVNEINGGNAQIQEYNDRLAAITSETESAIHAANDAFSAAQIQLPTLGYEQEQAQAALAQALQQKNGLSPLASAEELSQAAQAYQTAFDAAQAASKKLSDAQTTVNNAKENYDQIVATAADTSQTIIDNLDKAEKIVATTQDQLAGFDAAGADAASGAPEKTDTELADKTQAYRDVYHDAFKLAAKLIEADKTKNSADAGAAAGAQDAQDGKAMTDLTDNGPDYQTAYKQAYYAYQKTNGTYEQGYAAGQADAAKGSQEQTGDTFGSKSNAYWTGYHAGFADTRGNILDTNDARIRLQTAIRNGQALIANHASEYTPANIRIFQQALDAATGLLNKDNATIEQLAQAVTDLSTVAATLTKPTQPVTPTYPSTTPAQTVEMLTESPASGIAYVTAQAGIPLYSDKETINQIGRTLAANSSWKIFGQVTNSAGTIVAYNLGGKQYVKASDVTLTNPVTKGTFTVHYSDHPTWGIAVYNGALKVQKIIPAGSRWVTYGKKTINGQDYYNLGGDQFARADYGSWIAD